MKKKTSYLILSIIIVLGVALDLITKVIFANYFENNLDNIIVIPNFFEFTFVKNTGAAYGMFGDSTVMLTIVSILFIIAFFVYDYFNHKNEIWYILGLSFVISGAIGNLIDRIFLGYVRDFIAIKIFSFVFNIADLLITLGVIFIVIHLIKTFITERKESKDDSKQGKSRE